MWINFKIKIEIKNGKMHQTYSVEIIIQNLILMKIDPVLTGSLVESDRNFNLD